MMRLARIGSLFAVVVLLGCDNRPPPAPIDESRPAAPLDAPPPKEPGTNGSPEEDGAPLRPFGPGGTDMRPPELPKQGGGFIPPSLLQVQDAPPPPEDPTGEYRSTTFKELASFPYYSFGAPGFQDVDLTELGVNAIPEPIAALDQKKVAVSGFMMPLEIRNGLVRVFLLMRNQSSCCFGAPVSMNEWIDVTVADGHWAEYTMDRPIIVRGVLQVGEDKNEDGMVMSLYRMTEVKQIKVQ